MARAYYPDNGTYKPWTADMVGAQGYYKTYIDLRDAKYDNDTYYPVYGSSIPAGLHHIGLYADQPDCGTPSWSTHNSKNFTCSYDAYTKRGGYGWTDEKILVLQNTFMFSNTSPFSFVVYYKSGNPVFFLRGGGGYYLFADFPVTWTICTSSHELPRDTIEPTKTRPTPTSDYSNIWASLDWTNVTNKPSTFPPSSHNHAISDVNGLQSSLDSKAPNDVIVVSSTQPTSDTCKIWVKV